MQRLGSSIVKVWHRLLIRHIFRSIGCLFWLWGMITKKILNDNKTNFGASLTSSSNPSNGLLMSRMIADVSISTCGLRPHSHAAHPQPAVVPLDQARFQSQLFWLIPVPEPFPRLVFSELFWLPIVLSDARPRTISYSALSFLRSHASVACIFIVTFDPTVHPEAQLSPFDVVNSTIRGQCCSWCSWAFDANYFQSCFKLKTGHGWLFSVLYLTSLVPFSLS